jgi:hypothetical protein
MNSPDTVICELDGVRGGDTGFPVQLIRDGASGRVMVRVVNEGGFACADVDLFDLLDWLNRIAANRIDADAVVRALTTFTARTCSE